MKQLDVRRLLGFVWLRPESLWKMINNNQDVHKAKSFLLHVRVIHDQSFPDTARNYWLVDSFVSDSVLALAHFACWFLFTNNFFNSRNINFQEPSKVVNCFVSIWRHTLMSAFYKFCYVLLVQHSQPLARFLCLLSIITFCPIWRIILFQSTLSR